jgi:AFG3 family protein
MISLLGKRPFAGRSDEMDKWLDANPSTGEKDALPDVADAPPLPVAMRKDQTEL